jgi:hypothetical protein
VTIQRKCPDGFVRSKNGNCIQLPDDNEPLCPKGMRPDGEGGCERIGQSLPRGCPDGFFYNKRSQQCERLRRPVPSDAGDDGDVNEPPPIRRLNPQLNPQLNPEILQQLIPRKRTFDQGGGQECPDGMFRDKNGRCVQG